uniref:Uncharacterized protein n=1 Tax=Rhizophora mucronata TaxID=61149 RepID=A0A2P2PZ21_RHIMU
MDYREEDKGRLIMDLTLKMKIMSNKG